MICFEVSLNGNPLCTAGVGELGALSATLSWVRRRPDSPGDSQEQLDLRVGGVSTRTDGADYLDWVSNDLKAGDVVTVKVLEGEPQAPRSVRPAGGSDKAVKEARRKLYELLKQEFGSSSVATPTSDTEDPR